MDKPKATPKDFFLWAGAMLALYAGVFAFISLLFQYLDHVYPDTALNYYVDPYQSGVAYAMASLIVLAPTFLLLMRSIRRSIERDPSRNEVWVRRWALFLILFVAGITIVVDLIVLLNTFLSGEELTARFLLKVAVVLLVAAAGFMHFLADVHGYWTQNPNYAKYINWATGVLIALTIVAGFFIIGSPQDQRQMRIDQQRVSDLQSLQSQLTYTYQQKGRLPISLAELNDPLSYYTVPKDPVTGGDYGYRTTNAPNANPSFELCATFSTESVGVQTSYREAKPVARHAGPEERWQHGVGQTCFERIIDPELYPPYNR